MAKSFMHFLRPLEFAYTEIKAVNYYATLIMQIGQAFGLRGEALIRGGRKRHHDKFQDAFPRF